MFPSSETSYFKTKTLKRRKSEKLGQGSITMCLGHRACALAISKDALGVPWECYVRPAHLRCEGTGVILCDFVGLACVFSPNPVRHSHYKYQPSLFRISCSQP